MAMANTPAMYGGATADRAVPPGWEMKMEPDGRILYIDHNTKVGLSLPLIVTLPLSLTVKTVNSDRVDEQYNLQAVRIRLFCAR